MIDIKKEREAFTAKLRELKYFSHDSKLWSSEDNAFESCGVQTHWEMWLSSATQKQSEIDELEAKLAKVESGEWVIVPKEPTKQQIKYIIDQMKLTGGTDMAADIYKAMIEAVQELGL